MNEPMEPKFDIMTGLPLQKTVNIPEVPQAPEEKKKFGFSFTTKDFIFIALAVLAAIAGVALSFWGGMKLGFTISVAVIFALLTVYLFQGKLTVFGTVSGILTLLEAGVFAYTVNPLVNFGLVIAIFVTAAIWFSSLRGYTENFGDFSLFPHVFASTFGVSFGNLPKTFGGVFSSDNKKAGGIGKALLGIAVALPLIVIIAALLGNADAAFDALMSKIGENIGKTIAQVVVGLLTAPFLVAYMCGLKNTQKTAQEPAKKKGLQSIFVISFLAALSLIYLAYLFSQLAYLINGFAGILPEKMTYADYAKRGFFEIAFISGLNFVILFLVLLICDKKDGKLPVAVTVEALFVALMNLFLISTAAAKMVMYIKSYGLTELRIFASSAMVFFAVVTLALMLRFFFRKVRVLRVAVITASLLLLILGYGNMDAVICKHNIRMFRAGLTETNDCSVMYDLDTAGIPYLLEVYEHDTHPNEKEDAERYLDWLTEEYLITAVEIGEEDQLYRPRENEPGMWNYTYTRGIKLL